MNVKRKNFLSATISLFFALIAASTCLGQTFVAKASVSKQKILIGEQFFLTIEVSAATDQLSVLPLIDTIPHFEILEKMDPERSGNNTSQVYRLTSFDSGHWIIPPFRIAQRYLTDTIHMDVVFSDFDPNQDYHDIKDIIDVQPEKPVNWFWWIIAASFLVLLILIWLLTRRKKPVQKIIDSKDAYEEALDRLEELRKSNQPARELYSDIVDVFRVYVFKRKGILSLQKTTDDLVLQLADIGLHKPVFSDLSQALRLADFVKFARYQPTDADKQQTIDVIRQAIIGIEKTVVSLKSGV